MKVPLLKVGVFGAAIFCLIAMTSCTYDPYGNPYGSSYSSYTYSNYPYGYTTASLPYGYSSIYLGGSRYWHCNDHYYRHYPGRGYVVVRPPAGRPGHHRPSYNNNPTKYTHYNGDRYIYQNRPTHSHRGTSPQSSPSTGRYSTPYHTVRTGPSRPRTVRTQPVAVQPMRTQPSSRQVKSEPTNQSSTWNASEPSGGSTIHRNPNNSHSGMSRSAAPRSAPSRSAGSRGSGARRGR